MWIFIHYYMWISMCTSGGKLSKMPLSTTTIFQQQNNIWISHSQLSSFIQFICATFSLIKRLKRIKERVARIANKRAKKKYIIIIRHAIWKFICAPNDWVIMCGTFILSTENKSFLICYFIFFCFERIANAKWRDDPIFRKLYVFKRTILVIITKGLWKWLVSGVDLLVFSTLLVSFCVVYVMRPLLCLSFFSQSNHQTNSAGKKCTFFYRLFYKWIFIWLYISC